MITVTGVASVKGKDHELNEDRFRLLGAPVPFVTRAERGHLYAVMDGVGGAPLGMRAAQHAADRLPAFYRDPAVPATARGLHDLLAVVSAEIRGWGMVPGTDRPLGAAAATVAWFSPSRTLTVHHVGDTAAYRYDGERIHRLTREHGSGRAIYRYLGEAPGVALDHETLPFDEGDVLCLVTDGVTRTMTPDRIRDVLAEVPDPERAAKEIVVRARARGSRDDITALVVELDEW